MGQPADVAAGLPPAPGASPGVPGSLRLWVAVSLTGLTGYGALAASTWPPFLPLVPVVAGILMVMVGKGRWSLLGGVPLLSLLYAWLLVGPTDYRRFLIQDWVNHDRVNFLLSTWRQHPFFYLQNALGSTAACAAVCWLYKRHRRESERSLAAGVLVFLMANCWLQAATANPHFFWAMQSESKAAVLQNDNSTYKRIYFRMAAGQPFYAAHIESYLFHRTVPAPNTYLGYRVPGVFMLWSYLTGGRGMGVQFLYLGLCALSLVALYRTGRQLMSAGEALLAPTMVAPFLAYGIPGWHQLMAEYWALFCLLGALAFFAAGQGTGAAFLTSLACMIRLLAIPAALALSVAARFASRLHSRWMLAVPPLVGAVVMGAHVLVLGTAYREIVNGGLVGPAQYQGEGVRFLIKTAEFAAPFYARWDLLLPVVIAASLVCLVMLPRDLQVLFGLHLTGYLLLFYLKGEGWRHYWGILTMPFALTLAGWLPGLLLGWSGRRPSLSGSDAPPFHRPFRPACQARHERRRR